MKVEVSSFDENNPLRDLASSYLEHVLNARRNQAVQVILDAVREGADVRDVYMHVFQPVQYEIGRLWFTNQVSIAQEHYCTAITQLVMSYLYPWIMTWEKNGCTAVVCCVSEELHEIGVRMVSDFLEMRGWDTYYLGSNTPEEEIVNAAARQRPDLVGISATMRSHFYKVEAIISGIRQNPDLERTKIMVGGQYFLNHPQAWERCGADGFAPDADQAVEMAERLCAQR